MGGRVPAAVMSVEVLPDKRRACFSGQSFKPLDCMKVCRKKHTLFTSFTFEGWDDYGKFEAFRLVDVILNLAKPGLEDWTTELG